MPRSRSLRTAGQPVRGAVPRLAGHQSCRGWVLGKPGIATIGIRPEHVDLLPADAAAGLPARVEFIEELGDCRLVHLVGDTVTSWSPNRRPGLSMRPATGCVPAGARTTNCILMRAASGSRPDPAGRSCAGCREAEQPPCCRPREGYSRQGRCRENPLLYKKDRLYKHD